MGSTLRLRREPCVNHCAHLGPICCVREDDAHGLAGLGVHQLHLAVVEGRLQATPMEGWVLHRVIVRWTQALGTTTAPGVAAARDCARGCRRPRRTSIVTTKKSSGPVPVFTFFFLC